MPRTSPRLNRWLALTAAATALTLFGAPVAAQYQWRDAGGRMVFSDLPPPASVAPGRVISAPSVKREAAAPAGLGAAKAAAAAAPAAGTGTTAGVSVAAAADSNQSLADRELAYRKRLAERAEQEKKAEEESRRSLEVAKACADTQADIRSLESGQRISRINAAGEREFISDAERAERLSSARKNVGQRC
jgi:hypothetical protein